MNKSELKSIAEKLIELICRKWIIKLYKEGLKIEIKKDKSPVSNGDLKVNDIISNKISQLTQYSNYFWRNSWFKKEQS